VSKILRLYVGSPEWQIVYFEAVDSIMNRLFSERIERILFLFISVWMLSGACVEFYAIAWSSGNWLGQFSLKWFLLFLLFILFCAACLVSVMLSLWFPEKLTSVFVGASRLRDGLKGVRWLLVIIILGMPVYFFQYTPWGMIFGGSNFRALVWALSVVLIGWLLSAGSGQVLTWKKLLGALVLTAGAYSFFAQLVNITNYPFSLGWSEGNRLWDYSVLFGHAIYKYPADKTIPVFLDLGRQLVGGIPFLIPGITIWQERLWLGLIDVIPYLILGWFAFRLPRKNSPYWILAGIWAFTFVEQGPIHPPLLLCAIIIAVAWERPLWVAIPLIIVASYFAQLSRSTWLFAPGMWATVLEFSGAKLQENHLTKTTWLRAFSVGLAGILGGYLIPQFVVPAYQWVVNSGAGKNISFGSGLTASSINAQISNQPLLWYRLFPNSTYGPGIFIGLTYAVIPLLVVLVYLLSTRLWVLNLWQKSILTLFLFAFLAVGLIVSVKIGGGGDLHNMDMFIIGLMFVGAIAWRNSDQGWIEKDKISSPWLRITLLLLVIMPTYRPYMQLNPSVIDKNDISWVMTLADIPPTDSVLSSFPSETYISDALNSIRSEVTQASKQGDVLFMDQRQLLTFGYINDVSLIPAYDKKVLIDKALSGDAQYFQAYYHDLASQRFSLIISSPLHENIQTSSDDFGEENNAWVKWVSTPTLCYYETLRFIKKVGVELLVPRADISNCSQALP
jgi:hypothetical protein